jgi:hypothetical protein
MIIANFPLLKLANSSEFHRNSVTTARGMVKMVRQSLSIVIRIPDVVLSRSDLEAALGRPLDRYEQPTDRTSAFAQIDIPDDRDQWAAALDCVQSVRDPVQRLICESLIGLPCLDVAVGFRSSAVSTSLAIPAQLAAATGETGLDINISVYRTGPA